MKSHRQSRGNLSPPDPEKLGLMQQIAMDTLQGESGALIWTEHEGFQLRMNTDEQDTMPRGIYMLFLCYMRLSMDAEFADELQEWARRNQN